MSKMAIGKKRRSIASDIYALQREWDEALCAICMEHPHNAVLLICSSHAKGCRPYICDTSYRHSNCLDRYRKINPNNTRQTSGALSKKLNLACPLCRGDVQGWKVVEDARNLLNTKIRSCSRDSCPYAGNYRDLRKHARRVHPSARPAEIDPSRQQEWRRLEVQREYDDVLSSLRSAMPGAVVLGDYAIEDDAIEDDEDSDGTESGLLLTDRLYQLLAESRIRSREPGEASSAGRFILWGNPLGIHDQSDDGDGGYESRASSSSRGGRPRGNELGVTDDGDDDLPIWRRRRLS